MQQVIAPKPWYTQIINWVKDAPESVQITFIVAVTIILLWVSYWYLRSPKSNWIPGAKHLTKKTDA